MENVFEALAEALRERLAVIADREAAREDAAAHMARLKAVSMKIVELQGRLPERLDPQLRHYLERCSYDKALAALEAVRSDGQ